MHRLTWSAIRRWWGISACAGFYLANTVSLSFGALAVNDIVSAALSVAFVEYCTRLFYAAGPKPCVKLQHCATSAPRMTRTPCAGHSRYGFSTRSRCELMHGSASIAPREHADTANRFSQMGFVFGLVCDAFKLGG